MKKKRLNTLKIASLTLMLGCFAVGGVYNHYQDKQQDHVVKVERKVQPKYASYNDESYTITLTTEEINNYSFENLLNYYSNNNTNYIEEISFNDTSYFGGFYDSNSVSWSFGVDPEDITAGYRITLNEDYNFVWYALSSPSSYLDIEYDFILTVSSSYYDDIKQAIELDIQANQPVSMGENIIESIGSGLGIIPNIAGEFIAGFSKLLWNNNQLTNFAIYSLVFLGIAITFAVIKLILAIIRGNTGA